MFLLGHCVMGAGVVCCSLGGWLATVVSGGLLAGVFSLFGVTVSAGLGVCSVFCVLGGGCSFFS